MAMSDRRPPQQPIGVQPTTSIDDGARVRHIDELSEDALERFLALLDGRTPIVGPTADLEHGDVVVFTEYYRITVR